jgi:hypothetical protein
MSVCGCFPISNVRATCQSIEQGIYSSYISFPKLSKAQVGLDEIRYDGTVFRLNATIEIYLYMEDGLWNCEYQPFSSLSFGPTPEEALYSFCEDFSVLWHEIALAPDETLAEDAKSLKQAVLSAVKTVEAGGYACR